MKCVMQMSEISHLNSHPCQCLKYTESNSISNLTLPADILPEDLLEKILLGEEINSGQLSHLNRNKCQLHQNANYQNFNPPVLYINLNEKNKQNHPFPLSPTLQRKPFRLSQIGRGKVRQKCVDSVPL